MRWSRYFGPWSRCQGGSASSMETCGARTFGGFHTACSSAPTAKTSSWSGASTDGVTLVGGRPADDREMDTSRIVKALWPPALGWMPVGILLLENRHNPYGAHGVMGMIVITVVCAWVATPFCVVNAASAAQPQLPSGHRRCRALPSSVALSSCRRREAPSGAPGPILACDALWSPGHGTGLQVAARLHNRFSNSFPRSRRTR